MIRRLLGAVTFGGVTLAALTAFAANAEHAEHEPEWSLLVWHALGLLILGSVLVYFGRGPLQTLMRDRSDGIRRQLEAARSALERSEAANAAIRARLGRIAEENETMVREAAEIAERERARALERAQGAAERVREEARRTADQEIERARAELQSEAAKLAVSLAGELLRQSLTPDDERRLRGEFVTRIGQAS